MNIKQNSMKKWIPLFLTQFLGVLNDNLLKHLIIFIGILWVSEEFQEVVIPVASGILVLPYLIFSPLGGHLTIHRKKKSIVAIAKFTEIPIMLLATIGFSTESITILLVSLFLMGLQSALYSPAKLGLIKDISQGVNLSKGTGIMEVLGFTAILLSTILAGYIAELPTNQFTVIAALLMVIAVAGWVASIRIKPQDEPVLFRPTNTTILPLRFLKRSYASAKKTKGLNSTILALGIFWLIASLLQMNLLAHCNSTLALNAFETSVIWSVTIVGIATGCFLAGIINKHRVELGISVLGTIVLAICTSIIANSTLGTLSFGVVLFIGAVGAGLFKIPLNSWMQERSSSEELPRHLAYLNMIVFLIVLISSGLFAVAITTYDSFFVFKLINVICIGLALVMLFKNPSEFLRILIYLIAKWIYKMNINGTGNIPKDSGALIVANHLSFMDFILIVGAVPRQIRYVMFKGIYNIRGLKWLFKSLNMIPISPRNKNDLDEFNSLCQQQINQGHIVVIFAEGMITRNGHTHEFKRGLEHIGQGINAPIIPLHMDGVLGSPFTYLAGKTKAEKFQFKNLRKEVFVNIGSHLPPSATAFEVRQAVMELNAENLSNRIKDNQLIHHDFIKYSLTNLKKPAITTHLGILKHKMLLKKVYRRAKGINQTIGEETEAILFIKDPLEHAVTMLAMTLVGKTSILAHEDGENLSYLGKKFKTKTVLTDRPIGQTDYDPVWLSQLDNRKISFTRIWILNLFKRTDKYFNNNHEKFDSVVITSSGTETTSLSHQNILSTIYALEQVNDLDKYGQTTALFSKNTTMHAIINVWLPATQSIVGAYKNTMVNTIIGKNDDICEFLDKNNPLELEHIITDFSESSILTKLVSSRTVCIQTGFGLLGNTPILSLNTTDFHGKDIAGKPLFQIGSKPNSAGRPLPGIAVQIVDPSNWNKVLKANEVGTILIKGAQISSAFTTKSVEYFNGWLNTKLTGYLDEKGFVNLT
jgi:acyl-[acyl-carrier-protein]-phospholipid O-acyltransferase / long-chain-fatty-acid--[acyl-carrier-protein] ligase